MTEYMCVVGLDEPEVADLQTQVEQPLISHVALPRIVVKDGQLWVEGMRGPRMLPVSKMVFHGIYENDLDFITGLALWNGPCLPNAHAMMDCRLKLPCLARALRYTRFGSPRDFVMPGAHYDAAGQEQIAKWGNWHCGENKTRFTGLWTAEESSIVEPYFEGQAVRVVLIGDYCAQIRLEGDSWLKSIHHADAAFMDIDAELLEDTRTIREAFGLEIIANDYLVGNDGSKHLLEVNHIPNVTRFPEIWSVYRDYVAAWLRG
jgi:hypothetical protein